MLKIAPGRCGCGGVGLGARRWRAHPDVKGVPIAQLRVIAVFVAIGALLDLFDGPVARRFGSSGMGEPLDAVCDAVTFGLLPAAVVAASGVGGKHLGQAVLIGVGGIYFVAMILRLVRSWMTSAEALGGGFQGMPSAPAGSATIAVVGLGASPALTGLLIAVLAMLLIGNFAYPRQSAGLMPIMAGGPTIGLLGLWGVLPLRPAMIAAIILAIAPVAAARAAVRRRRALSIPTPGAELAPSAIDLGTGPSA
ncbi:MAG: CDP-alcohol phosphatidyltransferase family protein [Solirubrobacteraceae bacterium]